MTDTPADPPAAGKSALLIVFLVVFVDLLGFGIVLPLLPRFAEDYLGDAPDGTKGAVVGGLLSAFSLMQFLFSPVWGRVSDRAGRRPVLILGLAGSTAAYALFAYACTLPATAPIFALGLILFSRLAAGAAGATVGTAAAVIADSTTPEKRSRGMALIGAAFGIGFTFGPIIAFGALEAFPDTRSAPGVAASVLSAVALVLAVTLLPETLKPGPKPERQFFSLGRTLAVLKRPAVGPVVLISFLTVFAFANFEGTLALLTGDAFQFDKRANSLVFAFIGLVLVIVQGGVYRPLAARRPDEQLLALGVMMMTLGLIGVAGVAVGAHLLRAAGGETPLWLTPLFYFSIGVGVAGFAFSNPSVSSLVSRRADPLRQGEAIGVSQSATALARILGPFVGASIYYWNPTHALPYGLAVVTLLVAASVLPAVARGRAS